VVVYKVDRAKNDVVMDMPFVYVGGKDVFILPLCYRVGKLLSDFMGFLIKILIPTLPTTLGKAKLTDFCKRKTP
jgi:hypothetical protein